MSLEKNNEVIESKEQNIDKQNDAGRDKSFESSLSEIENDLKSSGFEKPKELPNDMSEKAKETYNKACENEKKITPELNEIVKENGGELAGLEYRIKSPESFQRKINTDMSEKGISEEEAIENMKDVVRYTSVSDFDKLAENYSCTINSLKDKDYNVIETKNTWDNEKNPYKGVNVSLESPEGQKFELQFHTPESLEAKEKMHKLYEEARLPSTPLERREELAKEMGEISSSLERPKDIDKI